MRFQPIEMGRPELTAKLLVGEIEQSAPVVGFKGMPARAQVQTDAIGKA